MRATYIGEQPLGSAFARILRVILFLAAVGLTGAFVVLLTTYVIFSRNLPEVRSIDDYRPPVVSQVFDQSGQLIGEFFRERRILVDYDMIPPKLVAAFLSSEDDRFFDHDGIDVYGILRAAITNFRAGRVVQGGSTVTQQVAKSFLINQQGYKQGTARNITRKLQEAILAERLEKYLTKQEIISIYLNEVFLGNQSYGIQSAAQNYFRKNVWDLNVAEIALLAGLPQAPSRYSPFLNPERAKRRRVYVLRRMKEEGIITQAELEQAEATAIKVYPARSFSREVTPYFTEEVRRRVIEMESLLTEDEKPKADALSDKEYQKALSEAIWEKVLTAGYKIYTTVDAERYRAAEDAAYTKLRLVDKRQGYRADLAHLETEEEKDDFFKAYAQELKTINRYEELQDGELYVGVVTKVSQSKQVIYLKIGPHSAVLPLAAMRWARKVNPVRRFDSALLSKIPSSSKAKEEPNFVPNDVLLVRKISIEQLENEPLVSKSGLKSIKKLKLKPTTHIVVLEQEPNLETALLSVHNPSGYVLAMLGGYSFDRSEFNRALQSCRQPGSSFKPIIYSAGLEIKGMTPAHVLLDAAITFYNAEAKHKWNPNNFGSRFEGEVTLRRALRNSMNVPAIKILRQVGLENAINWARSLGLTTELRPELGLVLGSSCVKMDELTNAYRTFANGGAKSDIKFITRIENRNGAVVYDDGWAADPWSTKTTQIARAYAQTKEAPERVMSEQNAYVMTKLMRNVVEDGTGTEAKELGMPVAGKTGTTNDSFDAWFVGFTENIATAVWVGFDDYQQPMGSYEQGGRAALPIWVDYMKKASKIVTKEFSKPEGIVSVVIDEKTGKLAKPGSSSTAVQEDFVKGTEPKEYGSKTEEPSIDDYYLYEN